MSVSRIDDRKNSVPKLSLADLFLSISLQTGDQQGFNFLESLIQHLTIHMNMEFSAIYEIVREGKYSLSKLIEYKHQNKKNEELHNLNAKSVNFLIQDESIVCLRGEIADNTVFQNLPDVKSLVSICLRDNEQKVSGILIFGSRQLTEVSDVFIRLLKLFKPRIESELDRFRLQFALEYSRDQSRYISDHSRDMIWSIDNDGIYTYVNRACYDIYGYEPDEMIGQHYSKFINKKLTSEFDDHIEKTRHDNNVHKLITQHQSSKGYPVKLICTTKTLHDRNGQINGISGTSTDITEFIRSQILFKNNNELFSKVLSRLPVIFFRINEDANIIDIRGRGLARLGVNDMEWIDKSSYGLFVGKDAEINAVLAGGTVSFESHGTLSNQPWSFFVSMFFDSWTGFGAIGFCVDITEQKLNEDKLAKLLNEKRHLNQRLVEIQEEERRNLARELHDEFGQSITAVKSLAKAITAFSGNQYSETRSLSNSIVDLSGKLYEVVNDMMRRLRPEILDTLGLKAAIKNCIERSQLELEGVNCEVFFSGDLTSLDEVITISVYRIVQECLTNISKYAMASNVKIEISRKIIKNENRRSREDPSEQYDKTDKVSIRDVLLVTIQDDGIGMDVEQALKKKEHGNRMGLIGIKERLIALDGNLEITSSLYHGVRIEAEMDIAAAKVVPVKNKNNKPEQVVI